MTARRNWWPSWIWQQVQALTGYSPHRALIVVAAGSNISNITQEHLAIVYALDMPFLIVVTKLDVIPPEDILFELKTFLAGYRYRKVPYLITNEDEVLNANAHQIYGANCSGFLCIECNWRRAGPVD